ncbi:hypothetical protein [Actinomycetospora flava]|uniref:Uncharacterized protein n=1 Tax=Actinomycetospora flava TaxID=3129232 RepID=A0ABU8MBY8_9PSEU
MSAMKRRPGGNGRCRCSREPGLGHFRPSSEDWPTLNQDRASERGGSEFAGAQKKARQWPGIVGAIAGIVGVIFSGTALIVADNTWAAGAVPFHNEIRTEAELDSMFSALTSHSSPVPGGALSAPWLDVDVVIASDLLKKAQAADEHEQGGEPASVEMMTTTCPDAEGRPTVSRIYLYDVDARYVGHRAQGDVYIRGVFEVTKIASDRKNGRTFCWVDLSKK